LLKPGFFTNENLALLPVRARLLYAGLWCLADREGRLEDRPERIKAALFPYERINIEPLLAMLHSAGFVKRYTAVYTRCLALPTFCAHQRPHPRERPSLLPPPPGGTDLGMSLDMPLQVDPDLDPDPDQDQDQRADARRSPYPQLVKLAHVVLDGLNPADDLPMSELCARLKDLAGTHKIPHTVGREITKAMDSAIAQRRAAS